jgi:phage protein D
MHMALTTDTIDKAKALLDEGAQRFQDYQSELSRVPAFSILMGGKALTQLDPRIISLELTDNRGFEADELTIAIDDSDGLIELPPRGAELSVSLGWQGEPLVYKGVYTVDEVAHSGPPDRLEITARSADFRDEFNVKREVSWHDVTVERIVSAIARRYKLTPVISEQLMSAEIDHADQTQESDMSFLTRMADLLGPLPPSKTVAFCLSCRVVASARTAKPCRSLRSPAPVATGIPSASPTVTLTPACRRTGWIWSLAKEKSHRQGTQEKDREKPRSSAREGDYIAGEDGNVFVLRTTYSSEIAAQRAAAAKWQQLKRGAAEFNMTLAYGRADLYPEMHGTVSGFKTDINNQDWIIAKATHTIDDGGFKTQLELEAKIPEWIAETES